MYCACSAATLLGLGPPRKMLEYGSFSSAMEQAQKAQQQ